MGRPKLEERINSWGQCKICFTYGPYTKHHVIPKSIKPGHSRKVKLCARCHTKVHDTFTNEQLSVTEWIEVANKVKKLI